MYVTLYKKAHFKKVKAFSSRLNVYLHTLTSEVGIAEKLCEELLPHYRLIPHETMLQMK